MLANLHHILGRSYYELNMLDEAEESFEKALDIYDENTDFYRDYAIALAKNGKSDEGSEMLDKAIDEGLGDASVNLVQGEIYAADGDYKKAANAFELSVHTADGAELKLRAYLAAADVYYKNLNDYAAMVELLEEATALPELSGSSILKEKLGEAYSYAAQQTEEDRYYHSAIACFEELIDSGDNRYYLYYNISVLYRALGDFESAEEWLFSADEAHPERYETYKTLAFIEIEKQAFKSSHLRSYAKAYEYYCVAEELYETANAEDVEMLELRSRIDDIKSQGKLY